MGLFNGPGYSRANSNELAAYTEGNRQLRFKIITFCSLTKHIAVSLSMLIIGWLMEKSKNILI